MTKGRINMNSKKIFFYGVFCIFFILPCFSERKTRVDRYADNQVKIIWSSKYSVGPDNKNWAKDMGFSDEVWESAINYIYIINPKNTNDNSKMVRIGLYTYKNTRGNDYKYYTLVEKVRDGIVEKIAEYYYYTYEYNLAKNDFDKWAKVYEKYISFDAGG